ncbi:hypothetical protein A1O3_10244 [Capronia epimyces CBS 606.96]|uniref:Uncharacterized protein n=1 Tax=Capronia epimyces CBS 606.96 TaxID=1182542 RepID=W9XJD6_9EURO|nr:uncharacterized protein A1O3_10244 [Capronia epimyces CBS 606.96]EXJ77086.1 hypothetical protein A1O3_10244 [Capronia epimyces CBS 606.96]
MRAAAYLLGEHLDQHRKGRQCDDGNRLRRRPVSFLIRGEEVSHVEFLRYFRRKKVSDPVAWVREQGKKGDSVLSEDVELVTGIATPESDSEENEKEHEYEHDHDHDHDAAVAEREAELWVDVARVQPTEEIEEQDLLPDRMAGRDPFQEYAAANSPLRRQDMQSHISDQMSTSTSVSFPRTGPLQASSAWTLTLTPVLFRPQAFHALEHLNYSMSTYISSYAASARSLRHMEPAVHAYTVHAVFASKMADGMALLKRISRQQQYHKAKVPDQTAAQAFASFHHGFELVRTILRDDHPMSLAVILGTVCELISHTGLVGGGGEGDGDGDGDHGSSTAANDKPVTLFWTVTAQLLQYLSEMASLVLGSGHALTAFFAVLAQEALSLSLSLSQALNLNGRAAALEARLNLANLIVNTLRVATGQYLSFTRSSTTSATSASAHDWKTLYLRERFCDSLYHSGPSFAHERAQERRLLLHDQERFYGPTARNVLYTMTNVADDALENGDVVGAIEHFNQVLTRADLLSDYGRAKTRFAALEGLGKCFIARAEAEGEAAASRSDNVYAAPELDPRLGVGSGTGDINTDVDDATLGHSSAYAYTQLNTNILSGQFAGITSIPVTVTAPTTAVHCVCACSCACHSHNHATGPSHPSYSGESSNLGTGTATPSTSSSSSSSSRPASLNEQILEQDPIPYPYQDPSQGGHSRGDGDGDDGQTGSVWFQQQDLQFVAGHTQVQPQTQAQAQAQTETRSQIQMPMKNPNPSITRNLGENGMQGYCLPLRQYSPQLPGEDAALAGGVGYSVQSSIYPHLELGDSEQRQEQERERERERELRKESERARERELMERERELQRRRELLERERELLEGEIKLQRERELLEGEIKLQRERERQSKRQDDLHQALRYFCAAEAEARVWFDTTSRRTARVRAKIDEIREMVTATEF